MKKVIRVTPHAGQIAEFNLRLLEAVVGEATGTGELILSGPRYKSAQSKDPRPVDSEKRKRARKAKRAARRTNRS